MYARVNSFVKIKYFHGILWLVCCFDDDDNLVMKSSVQRSAIRSGVDFCLLLDLNQNLEVQSWELGALTTWLPDASCVVLKKNFRGPN